MSIASRRERNERLAGAAEKSVGRGAVMPPAEDGGLDGGEFDAEAGRDVRTELAYIRSGHEKRNYGC